jgi:hypothetical protein
MKIPFEDNLPSDVRLYVGTKSNPNLSILEACCLEFFYTIVLVNYGEVLIF